MCSCCFCLACRTPSFVEFILLFSSSVHGPLVPPWHLTSGAVTHFKTEKKKEKKKGQSFNNLIGHLFFVFCCAVGVNLFWSHALQVMYQFILFYRFIYLQVVLMYSFFFFSQRLGYQYESMLTIYSLLSQSYLFLRVHLH